MQHMLSAPSSFPHMTFPPTLMNQNKGLHQDRNGTICRSSKLPLIKFCLFLFSAHLSSIHRPAGPSQTPKPWANGAGKTSELSVGPPPSSQLPSPSISVTPPASKGNTITCVVILFCLYMHIHRYIVPNSFFILLRHDNVS